MESYDELTLKSWLSTAPDEELIFQFIRATRRQDTPIVSLTIKELASRKIYHPIEHILDTFVIERAIKFTPEFSATLKELLVTHCIESSLIAPYCDYILATTKFPTTQSDLEIAPSLIRSCFYEAFESTISELASKYSDSHTIYPAIFIGIQNYKNVFNNSRHEYVWCDTGDFACLYIESGELKNEDKIPKAMSILYRKKIQTPLPPITSLAPWKNYTPKTGKWKSIFGEESDAFYIRLMEFKSPYSPPPSHIS